MSTNTPSSQTKSSKHASSQKLSALLAEQHRRKGVPAADFVTACRIVEKETGALIPFELWNAQKQALADIVSHDFLIAVKGRQVGVTWLELAAMLWAGSMRGNRLFLIARQSLDYAQDAIRRLHVLRGSLPPEMARAVTSQTTMSITLENGSRFEALTATQQIGRGLAAYWTLADESAFWPWPEIQIAALESGSARMHIVTTGNGAGDAIHRIWQRAVAGEGRYHALFIPSSADPRRDAQWRQLNVEEAAEPRLARREHAETPDDAFASPEGCYFERWDPARNVTSHDPKRSVRVTRGVDFGLRRWACIWGYVTDDGQPVILDELDLVNRTTDEGAEAIRQRDAEHGFNEPPLASYCDPAGRGANTQTAESEFDVFARAGLNPYGRPSAIRDGCLRMVGAIADPERPLLVHERCTHLITALSAVKPHRTRPDLYDFDHPEYSHILDAARYWLLNVSRSEAWTPPAEQQTIAKGLKSHVF